jgi:HD-GYP domain-containing protein (c-di-GMP phosphodiesterase class II)
MPWIGKIVVQVHERRDGSGYPQGLQGDEIHEVARILGLVDTYLGMAQPRADRPALVTYNALMEIIDLRRAYFGSKLIKVLINVVSIFPLGSLVKLNNGEIGRVVGISRLHPTRPLVEVTLGPRGKPLEPPRCVNLEDEPMLYIVDPAIEEGVLKK